MSYNYQGSYVGGFAQKEADMRASEEQESYPNKCPLKLTELLNRHCDEYITVEYKCESCGKFFRSLQKHTVLLMILLTGLLEK